MELPELLQVSRTMDPTGDQVNFSLKILLLLILPHWPAFSRLATCTSCVQTSCLRVIQTRRFQNSRLWILRTGRLRNACFSAQEIYQLERILDSMATSSTVSRILFNTVQSARINLGKRCPRHEGGATPYQPREMYLDRIICQLVDRKLRQAFTSYRRSTCQTCYFGLIHVFNLKWSGFKSLKRELYQHGISPAGPVCKTSNGSYIEGICQRL